MPRSAVLLLTVFTFLPLSSGMQQRAASDAPFRTIRGQVVSDDPNATPLRRVRIAVSAANIVSSPSHTDEERAVRDLRLVQRPR